MQIAIEGYKNLENVSFEITDNKINMIFGMSGSGKSSISGALLHEGLKDNRTIGKSINQTIKVNGSSDLPSIACFNKQTLEKYVINKVTDDVIDIFIDDKKKIKKAEETLITKLEELDKSLEASQYNYAALLNIKKELGSDLNVKGELKATAKVNKLENSVAKVGNAKIISKIQNMSSEKFKWLKQGMVIKIDDNCPFCERRILKDRAKILNNLNEFEEKTIDSIIRVQGNNNNLLGSINLTLKGIREMKAEIVSIINALNDFDKLSDFSSDIKRFEYNKWTSELKLSNDFVKYFPELYKISESVLKNIKMFHKLMENARNNTKRILSRRLTAINKYLEQMSIPYKICAEYANGKIKNYKIVHVNDSMENDKSNSPSEGEKSVIALIMFVYQCKSDNNDLIIIDDPASSYDDFRRSQILKLIDRELNNRTILLLSHDDIFAKYALANDYKHTDKLYYFENYGGTVHFTSISKDDFGNFDDFIIERIKSADDYLQKIINLRMLYEGNYQAYAYGYLSAILHRCDSDRLKEIIKNRNTTEERIIELIKEKYPEIADVDIPLYREGNRINLDNYSILEKAFLAREYLLNNLDKENLIDELNEFAHINAKLKVCLNPHKYNFCTKRLYEYLSSISIDNYVVLDIEAK